MYEAVSIDVQVEAQVEFEVLQDFTLVGKIENMTLTMTDMEVYF